MGHRAQLRQASKPLSCSTATERTEVKKHVSGDIRKMSESFIVPRDAEEAGANSIGMSWSLLRKWKWKWQ